MESIWNILELEPTKDIAAIKHAYAKQARTYHPEENPEMFLKLRKAYQAALAYGEEADNMPKQREEFQKSPQHKAHHELPQEKLQQSKTQQEKTQQLLPQPKTAENLAPFQDQKSLSDSQWTRNQQSENEEWILCDDVQTNGPNPYVEHEANLQFMKLYTGKQRKNSKNWLDYFTSSAFLDVAWEPAFTALLLQNVTQTEQEYPPTREFLTWLYAVYQFSASVSTILLPNGKESREIRFHLYENARFDGMDSIFNIASKGPVPKRPAGNELAILSSFSEYRHLIILAENGNWGEQAFSEASQIIGRYNLAYIKERCVRMEMNDVERHPASLRILVHFFERKDLPEELYHILWKRLKLKNATMGRTKIFYGRLRELVLDHIPKIEYEVSENFLLLKKDYITYCAHLRQLSDRNPKKALEETDAFFAREDLKRALQDRYFAEETVLFWIHKDQSEYFLQKITDFYQQNSSVPCAKQILEKIAQTRDIQTVNKQIKEDTNAPVPKGRLTLTYRPFFRHWLNTGFYQARDETGQPLLFYLNHAFPYVPEWSRKFLEADENTGIPEPKCLVIPFHNTNIEIRFHLRYMEFLINQTPVYRPVLDWNWVSALDDSDQFFFLLPITVTTYERYDEVMTEIRNRLRDTAAPEQGLAIIASCLAGYICKLPVFHTVRKEAEAKYSLPLEVLIEDTEQVYGCTWYEKEQTLIFFEQTPSGRRMRSDKEYSPIRDEAAAISFAKDLLREAVSPSGIHVNLLNPLPEAVYAEPDFSAISCDPERIGADMPRELLENSVTIQQLQELFLLFADRKIKRLELSWTCQIPMGQNQGYPPRRSLVFLKDSPGYACLYFNDEQAKSYALLAIPSQYWTLESTEHESIPFHQSHLFHYNIHHSFSTIRQHLDTIFRQARYPNGITLHAGRLWSNATDNTHERHKYNLDKQLLGGFPAAWAYNRLSSKFYLSTYPAFIAYVDEQDHCETLTIKNQNRDQIQQVLLSFVWGKLKKLRLTWENIDIKAHIILLKDQERFMMAYLSDQKQKAEFYVADKKAYLNVEGKKYPKTSFLGRTTPSYLVHSDMAALRNGLELLLANMENPAVITEKFGAFATENPVKPRPYMTIRAELVDKCTV